MQAPVTRRRFHRCTDEGTRHIFSQCSTHQKAVIIVTTEIPLSAYYRFLVSLLAVVTAMAIPRVPVIRAQDTSPQVKLRAQPISVAAAFTLCRAHPAAQEQIWIRGWFVSSIMANGYVEGGLFDSRRAVPNTTYDRWDVNGNWRRYGALYVRIATQASFGPRSLTLHGRLNCTSYRFRTDRDPFPPPQLKPVYGTIQADRTGGITTWAMAGGLKLSLTVPSLSYPRNALIRVSVSIQNVSRHVVGYLIPGVSLPGVASPQAEVLDRSGRIVFPPAMPYMPPLPGPPPSLQPLQPGQTIRVSEYIVVRGARIRASQQFTPTWSLSVRRALNTLTTRPITVQLTAAPAPQITLQQTAAGPVLDVTRPPGLSGKMLRLSYADCGDTTSGPNFEYSWSWVHSGLHLTAGCSPLRAWHLRVAWLDHPVAALDYTPPQAPPTTTPAATVGRVL